MTAGAEQPETGPAWPRVTVVILNLCREEDTTACIRSLQRCGYPALRILLVDNGSPDGSGARLRARFPEIEYLGLPENFGFTGGNNRGIERALADGCDFVLLLNNDTVVEAGCVQALVEAAVGSADVGAVGAKILYYDDPGRIWFGGGTLSALRVAGLHGGEGWRDTDAPVSGPAEVSFLTGCCMLIPAPVLTRLGGFAEDLFAYVEDVELCLRITAAGYRLLYEPRARLLHRVPLESEPAAPWKITLRDRNRRRVARRNLTWTRRLGFALFFYPSRVFLCARYALSGDRPRAAAVWKGMLEP